MFDPLATLAKITNPSGKDFPHSQGTDFDLASVIQSAQALSSMIELEELIQQLSQIILQNSGAETCLLALPDLNNEWQIRSISTITEAGIITTQLSIPLTDCIDYPTQLICLVKNTKQSVASNTSQSLQNIDRYFVEYQSRGAFCLPILKQGKVLGVLYLEHRQAPDIFTENKKTVISFLCTQAAISLHNAQLYEESQQAAENIRLQQSDLELLLRNRQVMEIALRESENRYHRIISNVPGTLYQFELQADGTYRFNYLSARFAELFEIEAEAVLADISLLLDRIMPSDRQSFERSIKKAAKLGTSWNWSGRILTPAGQVKWIRGESMHQPTTDGSIVWDGILIDITEQQIALHERKQSEIALRQSEERYQRLSDNIPGVIYQFRIAPDGSFNYPYISSVCWELFQLTPAEVMTDSQCVINMIHPEDLAYFGQITAESAQNMTPKLWEGRAVLNSGEIKWIKSVSRPTMQADGSIIWDGVMLDITERKQAQLNLNLMNEQLELTIAELQGATRLKDEFLATMSHELRTPLNAILGMSESLQEEIFGAINARQLNAILTIEQSGQHLLALINDVLDVSKISAGKLELHIMPVDIAELCRSSLILVRQQASEKQIQIDTHLSADLDQILVDERRLRQVLINLLSNAIKFTAPGGQVVLSVAVTAPGVSHYPAEYSVCLAVSDTGIGIASTDLPKLFQPFIQIDSNLNRKYDGTGLGLVLVKQIVELHGGYVTINSEVGKGSCFSVVLPQTDMKPSEPSSQSTNSEQHYSHRQSIGNTSSALPPHTSPLVLLAEDNEININTLSSYLTAKGYRIILAQNGHEAISLNQTYHPDLILMDIQMPEMDGIVAIEHIRQHSQPKNIPIIALTALAMDGDREKCLAVGANRYLSKPFKLQELHNTIQECLNMN
jgi:signal transduction histidine kinase